MSLNHWADDGGGFSLAGPEWNRSPTLKTFEATVSFLYPRDQDRAASSLTQRKHGGFLFRLTSPLLSNLPLVELITGK